MPGESKPIVMLGLRCTGKSTVGRLVADLLGRPFVDLDDEIAALASDRDMEYDTVGEVLKALGEPAFRQVEAEALSRTLQVSSDCVLATGGGVVELEKNRALLGRRTVCVWLQAELDVLRERMSADPTERPALMGDDPSAELDLLAERRNPWYRELAAFEIDSGSEDPGTLGDSVVEQLEKRELA